VCVLRLCFSVFYVCVLVCFTFVFSFIFSVLCQCSSFSVLCSSSSAFMFKSVCFIS